MTEEIIIDKEDKTKKHRNNEIDCLHFGCRKGEGGNVLFWCDFYDDHCDNYTGCYYRKYLRLEQERDKLKKKLGTKEVQLANIEFDLHFEEMKTRELKQENKELKELNKKICEDCSKEIKVYWNAFEEIRILATKNVSIENFVKIQNKINEVLQ